MATVADHELVITRGEGVHVWDEQGRRYIDAAASLWYANVGHGRSEIADAVARQMRTLEAYQIFADLTNAPARDLCDRLAALATLPDARVFLTLGGSDGVETAAKLARQYWSLRGQPRKTHLISRTFAYHGIHGFGTSLGGMEPNKQGFGPLAPDVSQVDYDSVDALERELQRLGSERVAAFFCEPVIGAGGVRPAPPGYIEAVADLCERYEVLLVIDSVICGFGRLGTWFGYERFGIEPDMVILAKGITSGYLPLGAVLVGGRVAEPFWSTPGAATFRHGATYSGHPSCCAAAHANLDIFEAENLIPRGRELEGALMDALGPLSEHVCVAEVRGGVGLLAGIELVPELARAPGAVTAFYHAVREAGVIVRSQGTGAAITPPLTITHEQLDEIADGVRAGLDELAATYGGGARV
jgi:adenosylmethionine-8-amino-7-oxononanoate aminotransferase